MVRLKQKDLPSFREYHTKVQEGYCWLCRRVLDDPVLDHCHTSGHVRGVLCRTCNVLEGKILNWMNRFGKGVHKETFMLNLLLYWKKDWSQNPIHPKHRTPLQKELLQLKRKMRKVKLGTTKERYRSKIKELQARIDTDAGGD